jgi:hypothetical protein
MTNGASPGFPFLGKRNRDCGNALAPWLLLPAIQGSSESPHIVVFVRHIAAPGIAAFP